MNSQEIRNNSLIRSNSLGYQVNPDLPLLEEGMVVRPRKDIIERTLALFSVVSVAYGFNNKSALNWLEKEEVIEVLTDLEKQYLVNKIGDTSFFQSQVEALNALTWVLGIVKELDFSKGCPNNLITYFPDIKNNESSKKFNENANFRSREEILVACDLSYCIHWSITQAKLESKSLKVDVSPWVVIERRRSLEWALCEEDWDCISLDT